MVSDLQFSLEVFRVTGAYGIMIIKPTRVVTHLPLELLGHSSDGDTKILSSHGAGIPLGRPVDKQTNKSVRQLSDGSSALHESLNSVL